MINANLEQFLDNGWFNEATLYYDGHTYWCEGGFYGEDGRLIHFWVYRYKSDLFVNSEGKTYSKRHIENHDVVDYSTVFEISGKTEDEAREEFLKAKIFDGKSFWEVEKELAWYDED